MIEHFSFCLFFLLSISLANQVPVILFCGFGECLLAYKTIFKEVKQDREMITLG